jgi:hypothetical protein
MSESDKVHNIQFHQLATVSTAMCMLFWYNPKISGFGRLLVSMLASGSNPAEAVGFFGQKNLQHAFLRRGSKAVCPMSQMCGM